MQNLPGFGSKLSDFLSPKKQLIGDRKRDAKVLCHFGFTKEGVISKHFPHECPPRFWLASSSLWASFRSPRMIGMIGATPSLVGGIKNVPSLKMKKQG